MLRWKIEIDKTQGKYRPVIHLYTWIKGKLPNGEKECENPYNINPYFLLPILRLPWKHNTHSTAQYRHCPKLPFMLWEDLDPNNTATPSIKENDKVYCGFIGKRKIDIFTSEPQLLEHYYLDWIPNATPKTYEPVIQAFIEHWMLPLEREYNKRLTEAINSQAINISKTNDNYNDNNNQSKVTRKIKT